MENKVLVLIMISIFVSGGFGYMFGFMIGQEDGTEKCQDMLFEGINQIFNGAKINVDLNETELIDGFKEAAVELIDRKELEWKEEYDSKEIINKFAYRDK